MTIQEFADQTVERIDELQKAVRDLRGESRCKTCNWPLAATTKEGCTAESCSQRPLPKKSPMPAEMTVQFLAIGSKVSVAPIACSKDPPITGVVTEIVLRANDQINYRIGWWNGRTWCESLFDSFNVVAVHP